MKKSLLSIGLLAAGLLTAGNAMADATTAFSQDFTGESTAITDYGFTDNSSTGTLSVTGGVLQSVVGKTTTDCYADFTAIESGNVVTVSCTWVTGNATGRSKRSYSQLYLSDGTNTILDIKFYGQDYALYVNDTEFATKVTRNSTFAVTATINMSKQMITSLAIGESYTGTNIAFASTSATTLSRFGFKQVGVANWENTSTIDDVKITYEEYSAQTATVTFKYVDTEGNDLSAEKADFTASEEVSTSIGDIIYDTYKETFYSSDNATKYVYSAYTSDATEVAADGSTVVKLQYTPYSQVTATLTQAYGDNTNELTATFFADETKVINYPVCILENGTYYIAERNEASPYYGYTFSASDLTKTVTYTADTEGNIVFYGEGETMTASNNKRVTASSEDASNGVYVNYMSQGYYASSDELAAGDYSIEINILDRKPNSNTYVGVYDDEVNLLIDETINANNAAGVYTKTFTLTSSSRVNLGYANGNSGAFDYIIIRSASNKEITIGDIGYCTFSDPTFAYSVPNGVTAYTAAEPADGQVELTPISDGIIPANTGVVLGGEAGKHTLTAATASNPVETILEPSSTSLKGDGKTIYVLGKGSDGKAVFGPLKNGTKMTANKAYFTYTASSESEGYGAKLAIVIKGDATGISEVSSAVKSGKAYNLQGIEVGNNFKGLYIKDGKKVIK